MDKQGKESRRGPRAERSPEGRFSGGGRRGMKTSNVILALLGAFTAAFITAMTVIFCWKGAVPDALIQYTLGAGGAEALLLAGIKVSKVIVGEKEDPI